MKQNKNLKIKLLQTLQRIKNLDLLPKEKDDLFSQTKPFELTPIKNDISSLDPINFINEDYNQAKLNPISLEENLEHNEHNNVNIKKIGNIEEISGVDKSILKNKTQNYQNEPKQIDIASKPAIFLIGEFPDSKEIIEKLNLRAEILKKSESNSRKTHIRSKTERKHKSKKLEDNYLFLDHCRKEYIKCHKKSDPFLSENEIENNKKKKDEENQNIEVKKEMNKQLDSVKKIMRNLKKSQSPEKNHYINLFLNEIKEIEISETIDLTYEKTNPKPKKIHLEKAEEILLEIKKTIIEKKGVLSGDLIKRTKKFIENINIAYKKDKKFSENRENKRKSDKIKDDPKLSNEYNKLKAFLKKVCKLFNSKYMLFCKNQEKNKFRKFCWIAIINILSIYNDEVVMNVDKTEQDNVDNFLKNPSLNFQMIDRLINDIERKEIDKNRLNIFYSNFKRIIKEANNLNENEKHLLKLVFGIKTLIEFLKDEKDIKFFEENQPKLNHIKNEKILKKRDLKKNSVGKKQKKIILEEENEKINEKFGINFMVWDENLNKIENEIKVLKKQKSIAKSSKIKKEKIEKTKEEDKNFVFEEKCSKKHENLLHEYHKDQIDFIKLHKMQEKQKNKEFASHEIDYYKENKEKGKIKHETFVKSHYLKNEKLIEEQKILREKEKVFEKAKRMLEKQESLLDTKKKYIQN